MGSVRSGIVVSPLTATPRRRGVPASFSERDLGMTIAGVLGIRQVEDPPCGLVIRFRRELDHALPRRHLIRETK